RESGPPWGRRPSTAPGRRRRARCRRVRPWAVWRAPWRWWYSSRIAADQFDGPLADHQHRDHRVHGGHGREDGGVRDADALQSADAQLGDDDGLFVVGGTHPAGARRVVDGVGDLAGVLAQLLVTGDVRSGGDLALEPVGQRFGLRDLAGDADAVDEGAAVVVVLVGEVAEVEGGLDLG